VPAILRYLLVFLTSSGKHRHSLSNYPTNFPILRLLNNRTTLNAV
jgi:hypothetical protein